MTQPGGNRVSHPDIIGTIEKPPRHHWTASEIEALSDAFRAGLSDDEIAAKIGRTRKSVHSKRINLKLTRCRAYVLRPMPDEFATLDDGSRTNEQLGKIYTASMETIARWRREAGTAGYRHKAHNKLPVPDDFADMASRLYFGALVEFYRVSGAVVRRWILECDVRPKAYVAPPKRWDPANSMSSSYVAVDVSLAGRAADHLRRCGFIPVYNHHKVNPKAPENEWCVGTRKMTSGDMIDLAEDKGFDPRAWSMVA
jgi:hypothetical protein